MEDHCIILKNFIALSTETCQQKLSCVCQLFNGVNRGAEIPSVRVVDCQGTGAGWAVTVKEDRSDFGSPHSVWRCSLKHLTQLCLRSVMTKPIAF